MSLRVHVLATSFAVSGALLLGFSPRAQATVWQPINTTARTQTEIDLDSIVKKDGVVTAWTQQVQATPVGSKSGAYFVYRTMKTQVRYACSMRSLAVMSRLYYDDTGTEVGAERKPEEPRIVVPETPEDREFAVACAADPKKTAQGLRKAEVVPARYMDGPAPGGRPGLIKTSADAHGADAHAPAPATAPKAAEPAVVAPKEAKAAEPKAAEASKPAHDAHGAHAAPAAKAEPAKKVVAAHGAPAAENREKTVERVLRDRGLKPAVIGAPATGHEEAHWDYVGENAPYRWGDMKSDFATCKSGQRQSPIDIRNPVVSELEPITFHYEESPLKVLNNGHTIQVEFAPGSFILHGGSRYELLQMHFHNPAEERVNGRAFDMVAHLVHKSAQGKLAVVAVLMSAGGANPFIETIWNTMPGTAGKTRERPEVQINPMSLLPADRNFYSFQGSLTTPPCTEGVQWLVMKTPVELGREQLNHFGALYPMNARPIQPVNDRVIKAGR